MNERTFLDTNVLVYAAEVADMPPPRCAVLGRLRAQGTTMIASAA